MNTVRVDEGMGEIEAAAQAWLAVDETVRALHRALADTPGGDPARWTELAAGVEEQRGLHVRLGRAVGRWLADGGELDLRAPVSAPAPEPACEPAPACEPEPCDDAVASAGVSLVHEVEAPAWGVVAPVVTPPAIEPTAPASVEVASDASAPIPAPAPPVRRAPQASPAELKQLLQVGIGGAAPDPEIAAARAQARAQDHIAALCRILRTPLGLDDVDAVLAWIRGAERVSALPDAILNPAATLVAARVRAAQTRVRDSRLDDAIGELVRWRRARDFGFVHGLARHHEPKLASWDEDAERALRGLTADEAPPSTPPTTCVEPHFDRLVPDGVAGLDAAQLRVAVRALLAAGVPADHPRLVALLAGRYDDLKTDSALKRVRKAVQQAEREARPKAACKDTPPADWPYWHLTRGKTAVIVGGDPRAQNRDRIREAFQFARVEWPEHDAKVLARIGERAKNGSVDVLLFIRFGGHIVDELALDAVRADVSRWVRMDHGYGVSEVRRAMEEHWRALAKPPSDDSDA